VSRSGLDPRVARSREALLRAALDELAAAGYAGFSMESVAERAGVGRSTLYRHWNDRLRLISEALESLNVQPRADTAEGPARAGVERLLGHLTDAVARGPVAGVVPALVHASELSREVAVFWHAYSLQRRAALVEALRRGVDSGELPAVDPELAADALSGAVFYRRLMTPAPMTADEVGDLVATVLGPS
jgi:TetR/AcrR family transcriptional regulator, regulator of autoinduction and epiphytic fitness